MPLCTGTRIIPPLVDLDFASCSSLRCPRSVLEELEEPARPDHLGPQGLGPSPELAIRCYERDGLIGRLSHDIDERVIATSLSVDHGDAIGETAGRTLARLAFEDDDHWLIDPSRINRRPYPVDKGSRGSRSVPPPPRGARADDIRCVNEKHRRAQLRCYSADLR